ncbi:MAG: response regulator [Hespellia sp.]|nr:response regulator [Hespellia sp.]
MNFDKYITVIVAEDEPIILNNISKKIENSADYITVIGKAPNGLKVLELFKTQVPDILITDIEMPGMNGLELIERVKSLYPAVHIIILSGYNNFEYARAAIQYGVKEYILKPVSQSDLTSSLSKLSETILTEKQYKDRNILSMTISGPENDVIPSQYFEGKNFILSLITIGNLPSQYVIPQYSNDSLRLWEQVDFQAYLNSSENLEHFWLIDETYQLQKFIILHTDAKELRPEYINLSLYNYLSSALAGIPFHLTTSDGTIPYTSIWSTAKQLRQLTKHSITMCSSSCTLLSQERNNVVWTAKEQRIKIDFLYQINTLHQLLKYIEDTLTQYIEQQIPQHYADNFLYEVYQILPLLFSVDKHACQLAMNSTLSALHAYRTATQLCTAITVSIKNLYHNYSPELTADSLYDKIRQYIDNNYTQKITSEDLQKRYGYTPSYINRIFKKEGKTSPLQYLTSLRIEHAKELLKQNADIKSIALAVGYDDARYFSRVFKNETGVIPSVWASENKEV